MLAGAGLDDSRARLGCRLPAHRDLGAIHAVDSGGNCIAHFNTHFDHFGRRARRESAALLLRWIAAIADRDPVVVTGDFNCREASRAYGILTGRHPASANAPLEFLRDTYYDSAQPPAGPRRTYRGLLGYFGLGRLDYIFLKNAVRTERYAVLADDSAASDHRPVVADLDFARASSP